MSEIGKQLVECVYCHASFQIKMSDPDEIALQQDLHFVDSPGCAALHRVMCEDNTERG